MGNICIYYISIHVHTHTYIYTRMKQIWRENHNRYRGMGSWSSFKAFMIWLGGAFIEVITSTTTKISKIK